MRASRSAASLILGGSHPKLVGTTELKAASLNGLKTLTRPRSAGRLVTPRKELSAGLKPQTLLKLEFRFEKGGHGLQWQNLIVTGVKGQAKDLGVQIGWRIYMVDGMLMNTGTEVWQKLQDAMWQWRTVTVVFFTDYRAIRMEEKIKEEEEERREAERLAKLPFTSTSDEKHLEQLKQEFMFQGYIDHAEDRAITLQQLQRVVDFSKDHCHRWRDTQPSYMSRNAGRKVHIDHMNWCHLHEWLVRPACAEKDCSLVELLTNQEQPPAFYLVHYWGDLVLNCLEGIKVHMQSRNLDQSTPYWLACCANRPHSLQDAFCPDLKATCFYKAMGAAKFQVVLLVDPKTDSNLLATCLSRLWCMYELCMCLDHPAAQLDLVQTKLEIKSPVKKASMVTQFLTPEEKDAELRTTNSGYKAKNDREKQFSLQIMEMALGVSVERAQITNQQDKRQILNIFAHRDLNEQAAEKHEAYGQVSARLRALFALAFWRRVMGGNVSDSDVHRVQGKLVEALHTGLRQKSLELDMAFMQVCSEKLKMLRACLPSSLQELKLDLRETELRNEDVIALAAGLPRDLEDLSLNLAGNEDLNDDGVEVGVGMAHPGVRSWFAACELVIRRGIHEQAS
ncbi:unnamed protein product [Symbiodinium natans]|uniref:Uncharacterized protein n=1 Tax=Symbiodinium natans TaxID=878477 RepID=A0A812IIV1_9DINO|nr:unnamed protein product [Symbiodinium natans]